MPSPSSNSVGEQGTSVLGRLWTFVRIMNVRLRFIFLMLLVGLFVGYWETIVNYYDRWTRPEAVVAAVQAEEIEYYCAMHPNIVRTEPGQCPICGMPLSKRSKTAAAQLPEGVLARRQLSPYKVALGGIATSPVEYRLLAREIRTVGIVDYDETRRAFIAARIKGRIDKLFVNYEGQHVEKGDPLAWIYSPDLLTTQEGLLVEYRRLQQMRAGNSHDLAAQESLVEDAQKRLILWGITEQQIDEILARGTSQTHLVIYSPMAGIVTEKNVLEGHYVEAGGDLYTIADLSRVWMQAKIFEDEMAGVDVGSAVETRSTAYPNEIFAGRIAFVAYTVDPTTRTVAARVEVDNPDYKLKPGMYAQAYIRLPVGKVTVLAEEEAKAALAPQAAKPSATSTDVLTAAYLDLTAAFFNDKTDEAALAKLRSEAETLKQRLTGEAAAHSNAIFESAVAMTGKPLAEQRKQLKSLSAHAIELLRKNPPAQVTLYVVHCPMVPADWLQSRKGINNPYYGPEMAYCGEVTGSIEHAGGGQGPQFAVGYYCPVFPDRLYEKPETCPLDKFPLKPARVERVLAVPASAVVNTGKRKIVYRESAPGTFDMLEIEAGNRAGEFYPVVSGLKEGDRVATAGAFLVDAENRLNPAASAQYFGASGGPQSGQQDKH